MKVKNLTKTYRLGKGRRVEALKGVSFDLPERGMVFILGKSGSGKSTLLQLLGGMDTPDGGEILSCGLRLDKATKKQSEAYRRNSCGFVFQEYNLIPELTAGENVELALRLCGEKQTTGRTEEALTRVGLEGYAGRKVTELSGGQRQRVAIARAVVKNPELILADEPTGALDEETGAEIFSLLKSLSDSCLVVTVTHDRASAEKYGDRVIELKEGEIAADSGGGYASDEREEAQKKEGGKLPVKAAVRLGAESFRRHPVRAAVSVLLSAVVFAAAGVTAAIGRINPERTAFLLMRESGIQSALYKSCEQTGAAMRFTKAERSELERGLGAPTFPVVLSEGEAENLGEAKCVYDSAQPVGFSDIAAAVAAGRPVEGELPDSDGEIAVTRFLAEVFAENGLYEGDGTLYPASESVLGAPLVTGGKEYRITAVVDTGFDGDGYAALRETTEGGGLAESFFSYLSQSAHALLFLPDLSPLTDEDEIRTGYASLSFGGTYAAEVEKIEKETGKYPVTKVAENAVGATLPAAFLPGMLRGIPAAGEFAGKYSDLGEAFAAVFAAYFAENAERYFLRAAEEGYPGTPDEYRAAIAGGGEAGYGATRAEMYFDAYTAGAAAFSLPDGFCCALADRSYGVGYSFAVAGIYPGGENDPILLSSDLYETVYREIGGVYDFLAVGGAEEGGALGLLAGETRDGHVFLMENEAIREARGQAEALDGIGRIGSALSAVFAVFAALLYLNFILQSARDRYASAAILRALGCGGGGIGAIFAWEGGAFGCGVFALASAGAAAVIRIADSILLRAGAGLFLLLASAIVLFSAVGSVVAAICVRRGKLSAYMRE